MSQEEKRFHIKHSKVLLVNKGNLSIYDPDTRIISDLNLKIDYRYPEYGDLNSEVELLNDSEIIYIEERVGTVGFSVLNFEKGKKRLIAQRKSIEYRYEVFTLFGKSKYAACCNSKFELHIWNLEEDKLINRFSLNKFNPPLRLNDILFIKTAWKIGKDELLLLCDRYKIVGFITGELVKNEKPVTFFTHFPLKDVMDQPKVIHKFDPSFNDHKLFYDVDLYKSWKIEILPRLRYLVISRNNIKIWKLDFITGNLSVEKVLTESDNWRVELIMERYGSPFNEFRTNTGIIDLPNENKFISSDLNSCLDFKKKEWIQLPELEKAEFKQALTIPGTSKEDRLNLKNLLIGKLNLLLPKDLINETFDFI